MNGETSGKAPRRRIYLIGPRGPYSFWNMQATVDLMGARASMPQVALATLLALTPPDVDVEYAWADENAAPVDFDLRCDLVALTGYTVHEPRIREIAARFRARGVPVALGGAFATLDPDEARPLCDHLFVGEAERTWPAFLRDWQAGRARDRYDQVERVDLSECRAPDWRFVSARDYLYFPVQTSRGCPNHCDFCDAIRIVGRKYRSKPVDLILEEVRNAHAKGAGTVFFSDDNFYVDRRFTGRLLDGLIAWNTQQARPLSFSTQVTVRIAEDPELLRRLADARFSVLFLGVETLRKACLDEVNKGQMARYDPVDLVRRVSAHGIIPFVALIVGFDHDDANSFAELRRFVDESVCPIASVSILNAPKFTALHERLRREGRLLTSFKGGWHFSTNVIPRSMPLDELLTRHRQLWLDLYEPRAFERRLRAWLEGVDYSTALYTRKRFDPATLARLYRLVRHFGFNVPPEVRSMLVRVLRDTWRRNPRLIHKVFTIVTQYWHYYDYARRAAAEPAGDDATPGGGDARDGQARIGQA